MVNIIKYPNSCKIEELDDVELFQELDKELSFKLNGAEFSAAYKGYINDFGEFVTWDGYRHLMSSTGRFPPGLLQRVLEFLDSKLIIPNIIDQRPEKTPTNEIDISKRLKDLDKIPRPYQIEIANTAIAHERGVIRAATGCGKNLISAMITAKIGLYTTILVIGKDLLYQGHQLYSELFNKPIGIIGDGKCEIHDINIASVWSVGKALGIIETNNLDEFSEKEKDISREKYKDIKQMLKSSKLVILDECHLAAAATLQGIFREIKSVEYLYGMSATPSRDDGANLLQEAYLGKKIVDLHARKLIDQGYLVEPIIRFLAPDPYPYKSGQYQKVYNKYITENSQRNGMVVKATLKMIEQGFIPLVLFNSIKHGDILYNLLKDKIPTVLLSGKNSSKIREHAKNNINSGNIKCVLASKIFECGVDIPCVSGLINSSGGKSSIRAMQKVGRVIRPYKGKRIAAVIDFADQAPYLKNHALRRKEIYETEFKVQWPGSVSKTLEVDPE
jgi:superfamily II DNA or RNA helicase